MYIPKHLSDEDVEYILQQGAPLTNGKIDHSKWENEIRQIDEFLPKMEFFDDNDELITEAEARKKLGEEQFISGLVRAVFHDSASRQGPSGEGVMFSASKYWQEIRKKEDRKR